MADFLNSEFMPYLRFYNLQFIKFRNWLTLRHGEPKSTLNSEMT